MGAEVPEAERGVYAASLTPDSIQAQRSQRGQERGKVRRTSDPQLFILVSRHFRSRAAHQRLVNKR